MTGLAAIGQRLQLLGEIGQIMDSVRTLALIEVQQMQASLDSQRRGVERMRAAGNRFIRTCLPSQPAPATAPRVILAVGSERGFCADFNSRVVEKLRALVPAGSADCMVIPVGFRLARKLPGATHGGESITGASVAPELDTTLSLIVERIAALSPRVSFDAVQVLYQAGGEREVRAEPLLAGLFDDDSDGSDMAPVLNLPAPVLLQDLVLEYVYARLHCILTTSYVAENDQRQQHLRTALDRIESQTAALGKRLNQLRQEQITEELEVILLSAG